MNRDDIIRMARQAANETRTMIPAEWTKPLIERFAALVAAAERDSMTKDGWRRCAVGQRTTQFCGMLEDAVKAEREECAEVAYKMRGPGQDNEVAMAIRARGEK